MSEKIKKFHKACQHIVDNQAAKALNWAVEYAKYGLLILNEDNIDLQARYILNNMTHWRGDIAKQVRADLKSLLKE